MDCCAYDRQFNARHAEDDLREYRRNGATGLTKALIDALSAGGIKGHSVLEIGGGIGAVHHELLRAGADAAVDVDASRAYVSAAREESERQGHADRVDYRVGDFVALADVIEPADVVALDRVICCYSDMSSLVARSAALAKGRYGLVYPRYTWLGRVAHRDDQYRGSACRGRHFGRTSIAPPMSTRSSLTTAWSGPSTERR